MEQLPVDPTTDRLRTWLASPWTRWLPQAARIAAWLFPVWLIVASILVPEALEPLKGVLWAVLPLAALFVLSRTKTVRWAHLSVIVSVTFLLGPLVALAERWAIELGSSGRPPIDRSILDIAAAGIVAGPLEELFKIWPVLLLPMVFRLRSSRFTMLDWMLIAAAGGAGFLALEEAARFAVEAARADSVLAPLREFFREGIGVQRGIGPLSGGLLSYNGALASHIVLTGFVGLSVGISSRMRTFVKWILPVVAYLWVVLDHSGFNATAGFTENFGGRDVLVRGYELLGSGGFLPVAFVALVLVATIVELRHESHALRPSLVSSADTPQFDRSDRPPHWAALLAAQIRELWGSARVRDGLQTWRRVAHRQQWQRQRLLLAVPPPSPRGREGRAAVALAAIATLVVMTLQLYGPVGIDLAFLLGALEAIGEWWESLGFGGQLLVMAGVVLLLVAVGGFALPAALSVVGSTEFGLSLAKPVSQIIRDPRRFVTKNGPGVVLQIGINSLVAALPGPRPPGLSYGIRESGEEAAERLVREADGLSQVIDYGGLDTLGRPTGVTARLTPASIATGTRASRSIRPPGFAGREAGHARGHLLANQLGGSGSEPSNLVTIFQRPANHPAMSGFEFQVRSMLEAGDVVDYAVTPMYRGSDLVPVGITMKAESADGLVFWTSILNRGS